VPDPRARHPDHHPALEIGDADGRSVNGVGAKAHAHAAPRGRRAAADVEDEGWDLLRESVVRYCGSPVGTIAACDPDDPTPLNYDQVFIRDFVPSGVAFLLKGGYDIVRNFILHTLQLQVVSLPHWDDSKFCYSNVDAVLLSICGILILDSETCCA
jgi:hypothetical protein